MGAIWCEIHAVVGKIKVCPHIHCYVSAKVGRESLFPSSNLQGIEAVTVLLSEFLFFPEPLLAYCFRCAKQRKLPTGNTRLRIRLLINFGAWNYLRKSNIYECSICYDERAEKIAGLKKDISDRFKELRPLIPREPDDEPAVNFT